MKQTLTLAAALLAGLSHQAAMGNATKRGPLLFNADGSFQISVFQDLHFGENAWDSWGPANDLKTVKVLERVLDRESPDLAVFNGDLITGENTFLENSTVYVDMMVAPLVARGVQWASTYGNHDYEVNITGSRILETEQRYPLSRTRSMVPGKLAGVSNYYLPVYPANCTRCNCAPELLLWFFDSRGGNYYQTHQPNGDRLPFPGWVDRSVVEWFKATNAKFVAKHGKVIPSLGFVHIPVHASQELQKSGVHPNKQPGINDDYPLSQQGKGWCSETEWGPGCTYAQQDLPFMKAVAETPGMVALFSGHDHGNTWCYKWDRKLPNVAVEGTGVNLCFGQHTGYGGYGTWSRGARQVRVTREGLKKLQVDTWNRLENGETVGSVQLNATYGSDLYPAVPNTRS